MYQIGEFSKLTSLTVKTLRYYDQEGLLSPSARSEGGYRLYSEEDLHRAEQISLLRRCGFSIAEIKDVLRNADSEEDLHTYLSEKRTQLLGQIRRERALVRSIECRLSQLQRKENFAMHYQVEETTIPAQQAATIRYKGSYTDCSAHISALYKAVGGRACGAPFHLCYDGDYVEEGDLEICLPVTGIGKGRGASLRTIPAQRCLTVTHAGPYDGFGGAYKALLDYAKAHSLTLGLPHRIIYRKGPGMVFRGNPNKYVSEIAVPIEG